MRRPDDPASDLGFEPAIALGERGRNDGGAPRRWQLGIALMACTGGGFLGVSLHTAFDGSVIAPRSPEVATSGDPRPAAAGERGDRIFHTPDVAAEKRTFTASVVAGDKSSIRARGFARIATTLALEHTRFADQVPRYDPGAAVARRGDAPPDLDPGPAPETSDVALRSEPLLPSADAPEPVLTDAEAASEVDRFAHRGGTSSEETLPGSRGPAELAPVGVRAGRSEGTTVGVVRASLPLLDVSMSPENLTVVHRSERSDGDGAAVSERLAVLRHGEGLDAVLRENGAAAAQAAAIEAALLTGAGRAPVEEGRRLRLTLASLDGRGPPQIVRLSVLSDEGSEATVAVDDRGRYRKVNPPDRPPVGPAGTGGRTEEADVGDEGLSLYDSLYETALRHGMPRPMIDDLIRIVGDDVDLERSVAAGDMLEAFYSDGNAPGHNHLLFVALTVRGETFKHYRFKSDDANGTNYFDERGRSVEKFLIREPVPSARISSPFGVRSHPILGYSRPHNGVDFAAPGGTPILAAGDGTVKEAVHSPSYGNHVEIQHENGYVTTYSHMASFARGIVDGGRVRQGQVVGYIGQTGLATGPHLHYEVIVNGHHVDPMRVKLGRTRELSGKLLDVYVRERARIDALMASDGSGLQALNLPRR